MGGFDIVAEVLQQMEAGDIQVQVDQQPYMQGFMPVMEAYLTKTVGLVPAETEYPQGRCGAGRRADADGTRQAGCSIGPGKRERGGRLAALHPSGQDRIAMPSLINRSDNGP